VAVQGHFSAPRSDFAHSTAGYTPLGDGTDSFVRSDEEPFILESSGTPGRCFALGKPATMADHRLIATPKER
jgi:hypothetical protein